MKNFYDNSFKESSFLYKNANSICSNFANLKEDNSFFYNYKKKIKYIDNYNDNSIISNYKQINSLHKRRIFPKDNKLSQNISSLFIENYESKSKYKNLFLISQQDDKKPSNSVINSIKKNKKTKIIFNKKKKNNNISDILRNDSILKLAKIKNKLKLSSEFEKTKESISSNSKREFIMKSNRRNKIKGNNKYLSKCKSSYLDTKNKIDNLDINRYINEKACHTKREKALYSKIYNRNKIQKYENYRIKRKYNKNNIFKKKNSILYKEDSIKLYPKVLSCKSINNKYSKKYSEKLLSNKKKKNNNSSAMDILSKNKVKNNSININNKINEKIENYINKSIKNSNKKITVNLNNSKFNTKKNDNYINTNLINNFQLEYEPKKVNLNKSQTQFILSPISSILTKTHENSISLFSTKNVNKKEIFTYREYPKLSIELSNKFKTNNNLQEMTQDSSELNNIVDLMKNQLGKYKCSTSYYLNGEKNFFCSPDGPEDFHFRFVELCKQNNSFLRRLNSNISKNNDINIEKIFEYQEDFENSEEQVPYI